MLEKNQAIGMFSPWLLNVTVFSIPALQIIVLVNFPLFFIEKSTSFKDNMTYMGSLCLLEKLLYQSNNTP